MKRLYLLASSYCLSLLVGGVAVLGAGCGKADNFDPEPLLVPWEQLSGRIAYVRGNNEIIVIDSATRNVRLAYKTQPNDWVRDITWHPSGSSLTATLLELGTARWSLVAIDIQGASMVALYPAVWSPTYAAWSKDGRIAFRAWGWPTEGLFIDGVYFPISRTMASFSAPSWSPDGTTLAVAMAPAGDLVLVDMASGTDSPLGPTNCHAPRYSPDGTTIAFNYEPPDLPEQLWFASVPGGVETHLSGADLIRPSHAAWSPDGSRLVVQSNTDYNHPKLYLVNASTGAATQLTAKDGHSPAWIP